MKVQKNKGKYGQLFEALLGKDADSARQDFYDGEMKSYACDYRGFAKSDTKIMMASQQLPWMLDPGVDEFFYGTPFEEKLSTVLFVPRLPSENVKDSVMLPPYLIDEYDSGTWGWLYDKFSEDMRWICHELQEKYYNYDPDNLKYPDDYFKDGTPKGPIQTTRDPIHNGLYLMLKTAGDTGEDGVKGTYLDIDGERVQVSTRQWAVYMTKLGHRAILDYLGYDPSYKCEDGELPEYDDEYYYDC